MHIQKQLKSRGSKHCDLNEFGQPKPNVHKEIKSEVISIGSAFRRLNYDIAAHPRMKKVEAVEDLLVEAMFLYNTILETPTDRGDYTKYRGRLRA